MLLLLSALLLLVIALAGWALTLVGLPGNWLIVVAAGIYAWIYPAGHAGTLGVRTLAVLVALAVLGEIVELAAAARGVSKAGGSRRAAVLALAGSVCGGMAGVLIGLPIPVVGSVVAAVLFAGLGAMVGAVCGELWRGRNLDASLEVGQRAFWGRLAGTLGKIMLGGVMLVALIVGLIV